MKSKKTRSLIIKSTLKQFYLVEQFIDAICDEFNVSNSYFGNIIVSVTEAVENAIKHGNKNDENKNVFITFYPTENGFSFLIEDEGEGFDFLSIPDPTDINIENIDLGNGLYLIKNLSDGVIFYEKGKKLEIIFKTSSINQEIALHRIKILKERYKVVNKH